MSEPELREFLLLPKTFLGCPSHGGGRGAVPRLSECRILPFHPGNCLFLPLSLREKLKSIAQATYTHSRNLAYFVFTYKGLLAAQGKKTPFHSFLAACIGGWLVFGDNNPVNSQVKALAESFCGQEEQQVCQEVVGGACFWWF